jgi:hypothetical protein
VGCEDLYSTEGIRIVSSTGVNSCGSATGVLEWFYCRSVRLVLLSECYIGSTAGVLAWFCFQFGILVLLSER